MHSLLFETIREELRAKTDAIFQYLENETNTITNTTDTTVYHHCCDKIDFWNLVETDEKKCGSCIYGHMTDGVFLHNHKMCDMCGKSYSTNGISLNDISLNGISLNGISLNDMWIYSKQIIFGAIKGLSTLFCQ